MKQTRIIMGMPITVDIVGEDAADDIGAVFDYFKEVDERFSVYKPDSEISQINKGLSKEHWSQEMAEVMDLCEQTKKLTEGYFNIQRKGKLDPSGLVKGWSIRNAAQLLLSKGRHNFYIEAGGDIQVHGTNDKGRLWVIGIRSPFTMTEIIKIVKLSDQGVATSGTYIRGQHIYNPHKGKSEVRDVKSLTVIGPDIYEADRYATAAFAMGKRGIAFIEATKGLEGYMVDADKIATYTSGFERYVA